jgi:hypothetical protein
VELLTIENINYDELLSEYRMIWNNRMLAAPDRSSEETLIERCLMRTLIREYGRINLKNTIPLLAESLNRQSQMKLRYHLSMSTMVLWRN